jgi:hypothetical protein
MNSDNYKRSLHMGIRNVTNWEPAKAVVESQWGHLLYEQWCERESKRWHASGKTARVVHDFKGCCCIAV